MYVKTNSKGVIFLACLLHHILQNVCIYAFVLWTSRLVDFETSTLEMLFAFIGKYNLI